MRIVGNMKIVDRFGNLMMHVYTFIKPAMGTPTGVSNGVFDAFAFHIW